MINTKIIYKLINFQDYLKTKRENESGSHLNKLKKERKRSRTERDIFDEGSDEDALKESDEDKKTFNLVEIKNDKMKRNESNRKNDQMNENVETSISNNNNNDLDNNQTMDEAFNELTDTGSKSYSS